MFTTLALFLTCFILYVWKLKTDSNYWQKRDVYFHKPLPIFGNVLQMMLLRKNEGDIMKNLYFKSDVPFFGTWFLNKPQLCIKSPNLIKQILVKDFTYFRDRYVFYEESDEFSANMLFFMEHRKWKHFRAKTTPMFSNCKMKSLFPEMQTVCESMVEFIKANSRAKSNVVNASDIFVKFTTQVAYSTGFGVDPKSFQNIDTPFVSFVRNIFTAKTFTVLSGIFFYYKSYLSKIFKFKMVKTSEANFLKEVFSSIEETRKLENIKRGDVMDFLLKFKDDSNLGDTEIVAQMAQFLVAGYDTTNTTISLAIYELALNKHIQDKLREEIYANLESNGEVSYDSLNIMEYLDKVINETLRKYPVFPFIGRTCIKDYKIPNTAVVIEKGVEVIISLSGMHHDPKFYPEPELFDPERFSKENINTRHPFSYLPFGKGPRSCIGERMGLMLVKLGIVHVIKNFEIDICNETNIPLQFDPRKMTLNVVDGVYVQFAKLG